MTHDGDNPANPGPLPPEGAVSTDPAALPAAEEAIDAEVKCAWRLIPDRSRRVRECGRLGSRPPYQAAGHHVYLDKIALELKGD